MPGGALPAAEHRNDLPLVDLVDDVSEKEVDRNAAVVEKKPLERHLVAGEEGVPPAKRRGSHAVSVEHRRVASVDRVVQKADVIGEVLDRFGRPVLFEILGGCKRHGGRRMQMSEHEARIVDREVIDDGDVHVRLVEFLGTDFFEN